MSRTPLALTTDRLQAAALRRAVAMVLRPRVTSGWQVVAGAFVVLMVGYGAAYSFAAFAGQLAEDFGASHADASLIYAVCGFSAFSLSAISGPLADRIGPCRPAIVGMLLVGAGLVLAAAATSFLQVLICYGLLIGCGIGLAYVPAVSAVQRWFERHRGLASGIAAAGVGVGTALVPPIAEALLRLGSWRLAFVICGLGAAVCGVGGALLLARPPESRGLPLDGAMACSKTTVPAAAMRGADVLPLYLGCLLVSLPVGLPFAHLVAFADAMPGVDWPEAVQLLGLVGAASIIGRLLLGAVADQLGRRATFLGCCWGVAAATLLWAAARDATLLSAFALVFGITWGGFVALLPAFITDLYGRALAGTMIGLLYTSRGLALLVGPPVVALAAHGAGGEAAPIAATAALGGVGAVLLGRVRANRRRPPEGA